MKRWLWLREETLAFAAAQQALVLFFAKLSKTYPELTRLRQHKQPEATGTFLVRGGKRKPELAVLPYFLVPFICLLIAWNLFT